MTKLAIFYGSNPIAIKAEPMTLGEYNEFRGWELEDDEEALSQGYLLELLNETPNTAEYEGYVTWADKEQFENSFTSSGNLSCGHAIELLNYSEALTISRQAWHQGEQLFFNEDGFIMVHDESGNNTPWSPTQDDMSARDYFVVGQ